MWIRTLFNIWRNFGLKGVFISLSYSLPSFCPDCEMDPKEINPEDMPDVAVSRDYKHCSPALIKRFINVATDFAQLYPGKTLLVTTTYRSPAEQNRLFQVGRTAPGQIATMLDGKNKKSRHNTFPSTALDFCVLIGGKVSFEERELYPVGELAKKYGLEWGGFWTRFPDYCHLQLWKADV